MRKRNFKYLLLIPLQFVISFLIFIAGSLADAYLEQGPLIVLH